MLAPRATPPTPDPRQLFWLKPETMQPAAHVCLASAGAKEVRLTLAAQDYTEPHVFEQDPHSWPTAVRANSF